VVLVFFRAPLLGELQFYHSDAHALIYPLKELVAGELRQGRLPLWDPHSLCGYPVLSSYIAGLFLPQNLLFLLLPFGYAFKLFVISKHLLAALFQFLFLRRLGLPRRAAAPGAALFALSGPLLSLSDFHAFAFECFPVMLWLWWRTLDPARSSTASRVHAWLLCVPGFTFAFFHGDLQTVYAAGILALFLPLAVGKCSWPRLGRCSLGLLALALATALLAAVQLLPAAAFLGESQRGALPREELLAHSLAPGAALEIAWPAGSSEAAASPDFVAFKYLGAVALLLGALGLCLALARPGPRRRAALFFGAAALLALLLALGSNFPLLEPLSGVLPGLTLFRYPQKWLGLLAFSLSTLAALGIAGISLRGHRRTALALGAAAVLDVFLAASPFLDERLVDSAVYSPGVLPRPREELADFDAAERLLRLPSSGAALGLRPPPLPAPGEERSPEESRDEFRARAIAWNIQTLLGNSASRAGLRRLSGLTSCRFRHAELLWEAAARRGRVPFLADLMAARWVFTTPPDAARFRGNPRLRGLLPDSPPAAAWETELGQLELYRRRPAALPRALVASELIEAGDDRAALEVIFAPGFDPRRTAVALADGAGRSNAIALAAPDVRDAVTAPAVRGKRDIPGVPDDAPDAPAAPAIRFLEDGASRVVLDVLRVGPPGGYLVLNDTYAPGWTARVDGRPRELFRANLFARGVAVPAGDCRVEFTYSPQGLRSGAILSALALAALATAMVLVTRGRRTQGAAAP
jgi:hypothetical protein